LRTERKRGQTCAVCELTIDKQYHRGHRTASTAEAGRSILFFVRRCWCSTILYHSWYPPYHAQENVKSTSNKAGDINITS